MLDNYVVLSEIRDAIKDIWFLLLIIEIAVVFIAAISLIKFSEPLLNRLIDPIIDKWLDKVQTKREKLS